MISLGSLRCPGSSSRPDPLVSGIFRVCRKDTARAAARLSAIGNGVTPVQMSPGAGLCGAPFRHHRAAPSCCPFAMEFFFTFITQGGEGGGKTNKKTGGMPT